MQKTTPTKNNQGQVVSAKAIRRRARREAIHAASEKFVKGSYDKLVFPKGKK